MPLSNPGPMHAKPARCSTERSRYR